MANIDTKGHIVRVNDKVVGDLESIGDISQKRNTKEYKAINADTVVVATGSISVDPISLSVIYDNADTAGMKELESVFNAGSSAKFEIELSDIITAGTGNGTTYTWNDVVVSEFKLSQEEDGKVIASFTAAVNGAPTVTAAS